MTKAKRKTRVWTDAEKAAALARLVENGGNVKKTVREFKTADGATVTETNLRRWRANPGDQPAPALVIDAKRARVDVLKSVLRQLEQGWDAALKQHPEIVQHLARKQPAALSTVIGTLTDKVLLLEGKATGINETRVSYVEPGALGRLALTVLEGGKAKEEAS